MSNRCSCGSYISYDPTCNCKGSGVSELSDWDTPSAKLSDLEDQQDFWGDSYPSAHPRGPRVGSSQGNERKNNTSTKPFVLCGGRVKEPEPKGCSPSSQNDKRQQKKPQRDFYSRILRDLKFASKKTPKENNTQTDTKVLRKNESEHLSTLVHGRSTKQPFCCQHPAQNAHPLKQMDTVDSVPQNSSSSLLTSATIENERHSSSNGKVFRYLNSNRSQDSAHDVANGKSAKQSAEHLQGPHVRRREKKKRKLKGLKARNSFSGDLSREKRLSFASVGYPNKGAPQHSLANRRAASEEAFDTVDTGETLERTFDSAVRDCSSLDEDFPEIRPFEWRFPLRSASAARRRRRRPSSFRSKNNERKNQRTKDPAPLPPDSKTAKAPGGAVDDWGFLSGDTDDPAEEGFESSRSSEGGKGGGVSSNLSLCSSVVDSEQMPMDVHKYAFSRNGNWPLLRTFEGSGVAGGESLEAGAEEGGRGTFSHCGGNCGVTSPRKLVSPFLGGSTAAYLDKDPLLCFSFRVPKEIKRPIPQKRQIHSPTLERGQDSPQRFPPLQPSAKNSQIKNFSATEHGRDSYRFPKKGDYFPRDPPASFPLGHLTVAPPCGTNRHGPSTFLPDGVPLVEEYGVCLLPSPKAAVEASHRLSWRSKTTEFRPKDRQQIESTRLDDLPLVNLSSLKNEVLDLSTKLDSTTREKNILKNSLASAQVIQSRLEREHQCRLESLTQRYEERLTELHSVIAELTRKVDQKRSDVIFEEDDEDGDTEDDCQKGERGVKDRVSLFMSEFSEDDHKDATEGSTSGTADSEGPFDPEVSEEALRDTQATDASTSCEIDDRAVEAGECIADLDVSGCRDRSTNCNVSDGLQNGEHEDVSDDVVCQGSSSAGLEEEVRILREENAGLQQALSLTQHNLAAQRSAVIALTHEREILRRKLREHENLQPALPQSAPQISDAVTVKGLRASPLLGVLGGPCSSPSLGVLSGTEKESLQGDPPRGGASSRSPSHQGDKQSPSQEDLQVICKLAERVRLKKAESGDQRVTGTELNSVGVWSTGVAEQLAASLQEESDAQELFHALATAGGALAPHERLREYELEIERLHARIDHLRAQNDVLSASLLESRAFSDRLSLLMGKVEAKDLGLKMAVGVLEQIQEGFEILTALQESEINLLVASCRAAGVGIATRSGTRKSGEMASVPDQQEDPLLNVRKAQEQRRTAENVARHLLSRLERSFENNVEGLEDRNGILSTSWSSNSSGISSDSGNMEEARLRVVLSRLQEERSHISASLQIPQSPSEEYLVPKVPLSETEAFKLDLENAVLMQELTAIREDRAELRAQVYLLEREKAGLELKVGTGEAQVAAYCVTIDHLKAELSQAKSLNSHESNGDSGVDSASSEVTEALRRESQMKTRVQDLVNTLEKVTKNSEARHRQSQEFINDLKKANGALLTAVDRLKKKYAFKVKRMEQQTLNMVERHSQQARLFKQRISFLEDQLGVQHASLQQSTTSETSL